MLLLIILNRYIIILFVSLFSFFAVKAQENTALLKLKNELSVMAKDPLFKCGQIGFSFVSADGKIKYNFNGEKSMTPASNMKAITTATALRILGENFRFETKLWYDGTISNGVLNGNIYIEGGGDPGLGTDRIKDNPDMNQLFSIWTGKIKEAGIISVKGSVIPVASIFEKNTMPGGWIWGDMGNYYGAGVSGLNINENLYKLVFKPGKIAGEDTKIIRIEPALNIQFYNQVKTGLPGSGDNAYIYGDPFSDFRYVNGTIPAGVNEFTIKGSIPNSELACAQLFLNYLNQTGIRVETIPSAYNNTFNSSSCKLLYTHYSPALKEIIKQTNVFSLNLYAEALLKIMAVKKGFPGEVKKGVNVLTDYWKGQGVDVEGMFVLDGSGLSPQNAIQPVQVVNILQLMAKDSIFIQSLPIAGESGTLARFCKGTIAEKRVLAKSGSISRVLCYSGYVKSKSGKLHTFSVMVNNYNGTYSAVANRLEKLMGILVEM